jgi:hypothetical protein
MKLTRILAIVAVVALICAVPFVAEATPPSDSAFTKDARPPKERGNQVIFREVDE